MTEAAAPTTSRVRRVPDREIEKMREAAERCLSEGGRCPDFPRCSVLLSMVAESGRARSSERLPR